MRSVVEAITTAWSSARRWAHAKPIPSGLSAPVMTATGRLLRSVRSDVLPLTVRVDRAALVDSATGQAWQLQRIP